MRRTARSIIAIDIDRARVPIGIFPTARVSVTGITPLG
jgi:hypothetical protein